jgi:glycosyltransferase involved in cell wall biosynthesis
MTRLSGTIVTLNEERNIARAIESMRCCEEITVVDSGSTDRTRAIAMNLGAHVIEQTWLGYAQQKNCAAAHAGCDWILSLDADEVLTEALDAEIWEWKRDGPRHAAYSMPRMAQYMGRWIRHSGWYPDRKIRLYDRRAARWTGDYVHESVAVDGATGQLEGDILHFTCESLSEHLRTMDRYTTLAARELGDGSSMCRLVLSPPWTFVRTYIFQQGFRDGFPGFTIAWMAALYTFLKYAKARERA